MKVALLSYWHPHANIKDARYVKSLMEDSGNEIACVWDKDYETAKMWGEHYGVDYETNLEKIWEREDIDGVIVTSEPKAHKEIFLAACKHHKHIFTEKVLSLSLKEALEIEKAVKESGIIFCISFMRLGIKQMVHAKTLLDSGILGEPVYFKCMCAHDQGLTGMPDSWFDPEITGGGAMIDMGFNSTYLARYIMGGMESVSSFFANLTNRKSEDNAVVQVSFKNGALGTLIASFTTPGMSVFELGLYGTKGSYYTRFNGGKQDAELHLAGKDIEVIKNDDIPELIEDPVKTWVKACKANTPSELYGIDAAVDMVKFMTAVYKSAENNGAKTEI